MTRFALPDLPLARWRETKTTLHLFMQIVGKVRLGLHPRMNHWWHAPFYVSGRGLTTFSIPDQGRTFEMEFDFVTHTLEVRTSDGKVRSIALENASVADFHARVFERLAEVNIHPRILARPFDPERCGSDLPFASDTMHATYDREYVDRFWRTLTFTEGVFRQFRGGFLGKSSPVHFFWHSFDLAVTRFSGRSASVAVGADPVTRDAYSHEVISAGFWPGDDNVPEPAYYTYVHPEPPGLADEPLQPAGARWQTHNGSSMALLTYADVRGAADPGADLARFVQSAYDAGASRAAWPEGLTLMPSVDP